MALSPLPADYPAFLAGLKERITLARLSAARAVNRESVALYWDIGRAILKKQQALGWGDGIVETVASDLRLAFPGATGFSARNVWDMRRLYTTYTDAEFISLAVTEPARVGEPSILRQPAAELANIQSSQHPAAPSAKGDGSEFLRQLVAEIPWGHHLLILNKLTTPAARLYYLHATSRFGWTRNVLLNQIKARAYERTLAEGKTHNFPTTLPAALAAQAEEALKSSYNLEFLGIHREIKERDLEDHLISQLHRFILELGYGFCFMGRQHRLTLGKKEYFIDLLFYHRFLKALVAIELKLGSFEPEHAGKMDFYLNLLDEKERGPGDSPSIGIILCGEKDHLEVEFALRSKATPIGVAEYHLVPNLPTELQGKLPTARQLADALQQAKPATNTP